MPPATAPSTPEEPHQAGVHAGLGYALFRPAAPPRGGVMILHGAGSAKESHFDFARALRADGLAALAVDLPGHGASEVPLGPDIVERLAAAAALLPRPLGLRGSSLGGYLALLAAEPLAADAVVAICPAPAAGLVHGLRAGRLPVAGGAGAAGLEALLLAPENEAMACVARLRVPLLLLHAEGDEIVPIEHSRALLRTYLAGQPPEGARGALIALPGGHHRSVQHDPELLARSSRFLRDALAAAAPESAGPSAKMDP